MSELSIVDFPAKKTIHWLNIGEDYPLETSVWDANYSPDLQESLRIFMIIEDLSQDARRIFKDC